MAEKYGFAVLSVLALIRGIVLLLVAVGIVAVGTVLFGSIGLLLGGLLGIVIGVFAVLEFALAYCFWTRPSWGFWLILVVYGIGAFLTVLGLLESRSIVSVIWLILDFIVLGYVVFNADEFD